MYKNTILIVNPIAGGAKGKKDVIKYLTKYFSNISQTVSIKNTAKRGDATDFALLAVQEKADLVVAVGGDGTINEIGSGLVNTNISMGIVPMGSGNGLARSLKIPQNVKKACELIEKGVVSPIDVGKVNSRYFFLVAGVGFDAVVGKKYDESPRRGPVPYFYHSIKEFIHYEAETIKFGFNDMTFQRNPFVFVVANGRQFGNNAIIAPTAKLNDGFLDVCIINQFTFLDAFSALPKLFTGALNKFSRAEFHKSQSIWIERQAPGYINIDGEPLLEEPMIKISVIPESLKIIAPQNCPSLS